MDIATLQSLGLNNITGKLYLAVLNSGTASVQMISAAAGMKRSSVYPYLTELVHDGFLEKVPLGKKEYYAAIDPQILLQQARQNLIITETELHAYKPTNLRPNVTVLTGLQALNETHKLLQTAHTIRFWSDLAVVEDKLSTAFDQLSSAIANRQIHTKEIIVNTPAAKRSAKRYAAIAGKYYQVRLATTGQITNNSAVFENTVLLFRLYQYNVSVIRIEDQSLAATFKTMFDLAWQSAERFIPR